MYLASVEKMTNKEVLTYPNPILTVHDSNLLPTDCEYILFEFFFYSYELISNTYEGSQRSVPDAIDANVLSELPMGCLGIMNLLMWMGNGH